MDLVSEGVVHCVTMHYCNNLFFFLCITSDLMCFRFKGLPFVSEDSQYQ